jgi:hypothetical protein
MLNNQMVPEKPVNGMSMVSTKAGGIMVDFTPISHQQTTGISMDINGHQL